MCPNKPCCYPGHIYLCHIADDEACAVDVAVAQCASPLTLGSNSASNSTQDDHNCTCCKFLLVLLAPAAERARKAARSTSVLLSFLFSLGPSGCAGSGLSSSAAFVCSASLAVLATFGIPVTKSVRSSALYLLSAHCVRHKTLRHLQTP